MTMGLVPCMLFRPGYPTGMYRLNSFRGGEIALIKS